MLRLLALTALIAAASASCPNDCSGHGMCNVHSACECYRNWQSADCSKRTCYFANAFVDTPQGDINADGRVDLPNVYDVKIYVETINAVDSSGTYGAAGSHELPAGLFLHLGAGAAGEQPADINAWASTAVTSVGFADPANGNRYTFTARVTTTDGKPPGVAGTCTETATSSVANDLAACNAVTALYTATACDAVMTEADGSVKACTYASSFQVYSAVAEGVTTATAYAALSSTVGTNTALGTWKVAVVDPATLTQPYLYNTQFSNKQTWEKYPTNHGHASPSNGQKRFYDEAHFYAECSGKGTCNRDSGECECYDGYTGSGCALLGCPNACSGHGVCRRLSDISASYTKWDRDKTQQCVCDNGYTGTDCADRVCPKGDDPITRAENHCVEALAWNANSVAATAAACAAHDNQIDCAAGSGCEWTLAQQPAILSFGYFHEVTAGNFALEFTDEFGERWTTSTLSMTAATAADVEAALEALPNNVVQDVLVDLHTVAEGSIDDSKTTTGRFWTVTFLSNTGNVDDLGVRYDYSANNGGTAVARHDDATSNGEFASLDYCADASANNCVSRMGTCTGADASCAAVTDLATSTACDGGTGCTYANAGVANTFDAVLGSAFIKGNAATDKYRFVADVADPQFYLVRSRAGTQENSLCSSRGICDYSTGLCKCFNGFTDDDCSRQNALAMY